MDRDELLKHEFHASDYMQWIGCGHQFELEKLLGRKKAWRHPAAINGSAIHHVIYLMYREGRFDFDRVELAKLYGDYFLREVASGRDSDIPVKWGEWAGMPKPQEVAIGYYAADALSMLEGFQKDERNRNANVLMSECRFTAEIDGIKWGGTPDLVVDMGDGTVDVRDFKSTLRKPGPVFRSLWPQAYVYALACEGASFSWPDPADHAAMLSDVKNLRVSRVTWIQLRDYIPYVRGSKKTGAKPGDPKGVAHYVTEITAQGMASQLKEMRMFTDAVLSGRMERRPSDATCSYCKVAQYCLMEHRGGISPDVLKELQVQEEDYE